MGCGGPSIIDGGTVWLAHRAHLMYRLSVCGFNWNPLAGLDSRLMVSSVSPMILASPNEPLGASLPAPRSEVRASNRRCVSCGTACRTGNIRLARSSLWSLLEPWSRTLRADGQALSRLGLKLLRTQLYVLKVEATRLQRRRAKSRQLKRNPTSSRNLPTFPPLLERIY